MKVEYRAGDIIKIIGRDHPFCDVTKGKNYEVIGVGKNNEIKIKNNRCCSQWATMDRHPYSGIVKVTNEFSVGDVVTGVYDHHVMYGIETNVTRIEGAKIWVEGSSAYWREDELRPVKSAPLCKEVTMEDIEDLYGCTVKVVR